MSFLPDLMALVQDDVLPAENADRLNAGRQGAVGHDEDALASVYLAD